MAARNVKTTRIIKILQEKSELVSNSNPLAIATIFITKYKDFIVLRQSSKSLAKKIIFIIDLIDKRSRYC